MKINTLAKFACASTLILGLSACLTPSNPNQNNSYATQMSGTNTNSTAGKTAAIPPGFAGFSDIPIPSQANMNLEQSLVLGDDGNWIGRLSMNTPFTINQMFDYYLSEMPNFGWEKITLLRAETSVLTYEQGDRIATITINQGTFGANTNVAFTVSPRGQDFNAMPVPASTVNP